MTDDTWDEAFIASAFVSWHTQPSEDGSYNPMTEEEASCTFFDWLRKVKADAWDEAYYSRAENMAREIWEDGDLLLNPYRD